MEALQGLAKASDQAFRRQHTCLRACFFPRLVADASAMEQVLAKSDLDWTMVRPPELTDKAYTGKCRVRTAHLPLFSLKISRADVADFMIRVIEDLSSVRTII